VLRNARHVEELRMDHGKHSISIPNYCARPRLAPLLLIFAFGPALAADHFYKLSGAQIAATLGGMQFTDEVHWRDVYEKDGTLRSYAMGRARVGTWRIRGNEMCIDFGNDGDTKCFEVWLQGNKVVMQRDAEDNTPNEGFLEERTDATPTVLGGKP
jgi:hypothetical protein